MLRDSAKIQKEDAKYMSRHLEEGAPPTEPLYSEQDARAVSQLFEPLDYGEWHELSPEFRLRFSDAGHILGSAISEMQIQDKGEMRRLVFTGDLGRRDLPILRDPQPVPGCDVLICESTYGNRVHPPAEDLKRKLLAIIRDAADSGGRVVIPAFSLGRTQQVVYFLNELREQGELPKIPVFVDSPLSVRLTDVYRRHHDIMDAQARQILDRDDDLFEFPELTYIRSQQESAALNHRRGAFVVISASGMCENGRIRHHLKHAVSDARNTIVIIGFQAQYTLGRRIVERQPKLHIFNRQQTLRAKVETVNGLSAHADINDFKWWYEKMAADGGVGQAFLVHGEPDAANALAQTIRDFCDEDPIIPGSSIRLWNLDKSFPSLSAINRGFGGSQIVDSVHFADRIILKHRPRTVVLYAGDNDIAAGKSAKTVAADFAQFVKTIHAKLPKTRILFIAIKPSLKRWKLADRMNKANMLIAGQCRKDDRLTYINIFEPMLAKDGMPKKDLFRKDGLHLNDKGYALWASILKPHLK
eukprot:g21442.t1